MTSERGEATSKTYAATRGDQWIPFLVRMARHRELKGDQRMSLAEIEAAVRQTVALTRSRVPTFYWTFHPLPARAGTGHALMVIDVYAPYPVYSVVTEGDEPAIAAAMTDEMEVAPVQALDDIIEAIEAACPLLIVTAELLDAGEPIHREEALPAWIEAEGME